MKPAPGGDGHNVLLSRCAFPPPGTSLRCGWSGGPDSTALVVLAQAAGCEVEAVHVDHGLRPGNDDHVRLGTMARILGLELTTLEVAIEDGPNLEERARIARRRALGPAVATGHTADDQAEGVLLAMLRGAGPWGLSAMRPGPARPLLGLRRSETVALCAGLGLSCVHDPTNASPAHLRNQVRAEVIPLLGEAAQRDPVPQLVRLADHQREVADLLDQQAATVDVSDGRVLSEAPRAVAVAALRRWWRAETGLEHPPDQRALERMLAVARPDGPPRSDVAERWRIARTGGRLRLERTSGCGAGQNENAAGGQH